MFAANVPHLLLRVMEILERCELWCSDFDKQPQAAHNLCYDLNCVQTTREFLIVQRRI